MNKKYMGASSSHEGATPDTNIFRCEDNDSSKVIQRIKNYFLDGEKGTAIDINRECFTGDVRKVISDLRKQGWKIRDTVIRGTQKLYWLDHEQRTAIIFGRWEGGEV